MLLLVFSIGADRYALDVNQVIEVLPLVQLKLVPEAPRGLAGMLNYHQKPIPVIDISELGLGSPSRRHVSTRIILLRAEVSGRERQIGIIAERVTEFIRKSNADFAAGEVPGERPPYLAGIAAHGVDLIQLVIPAGLAGTEISNHLFGSF